MAGASTYRTRLPLRVAVGAAAVFWALVMALLFRYPGAGLGTFVSAAAFLLFFLAFSALYDRNAITVTSDGIVVSGLLRRVPVRYEEILGIEVHPGLAGTVYEVLTRRGRVQFSSMFARHRELCQLLVEKAGLLRRS